jgi:hypothetical protein
MYTVSNSDMGYIIKYIELMIGNTDTHSHSLRTQNNVRMAKNLVEKLKAKQPFSAFSLPDDIKKALR